MEYIESLSSSYNFPQYYSSQNHKFLPTGRINWSCDEIKNSNGYYDSPEFLDHNDAHSTILRQSGQFFDVQQLDNESIKGSLSHLETSVRDFTTHWNPTEIVPSDSHFTPCSFYRQCQSAGENTNVNVSSESTNENRYAVINHDKLASMDSSPISSFNGEDMSSTEDFLDPKFNEDDDAITGKLIS